MPLNSVIICTDLRLNCFVIQRTSRCEDEGRASLHRTDGRASLIRTEGRASLLQDDNYAIRRNEGRASLIRNEGRASLLRTEGPTSLQEGRGLILEDERRRALHQELVRATLLREGRRTSPPHLEEGRALRLPSDESVGLRTPSGAVLGACALTVRGMVCTR